MSTFPGAGAPCLPVSYPLLTEQSVIKKMNVERPTSNIERRMKRKKIITKGLSQGLRNVQNGVLEYWSIVSKRHGS